MKKDINILELFSGIGGFAKGFMDAGFTINEHYFSEIDNHAIANYKYNFKNSKYVGSVETIRGKELGNIDVITFGSPCQDFSIAGRRKGLDGERSSLIGQAIRLVDEIRPSIFIWENVKGVFSSNDGADFWAVIVAFANLGNYRLEWQLLNTSWFLPQNRERIYLIGHLAGRSECGIFPFTENGQLLGITQKKQPAWFQAQNSSTIGTQTGLRSTDTFVNVPLKSGTLTGGGNSGGLHSDMTTIEVGTFRTHKSGQGFRKVQSDNCPTIPARAREDGSGMPVIVTHYGHKNKAAKVSQIVPTLKAESHGHEPMTKTNNSIRRLTEIECERLQGFPDDWTKYGNYNGSVKEISKTQRYKMLGNAVTVKVVEEIAKRLKVKNK
ncbi:MAG TPA: DNA (cytosine-5-)-methyltransferase [Crocinitomicaceae bacterium]|nr:DNA (cytosine-5-)-methyltransferase [Crocinitomicaceae bacterium]